MNAEAVQKIKEAEERASALRSDTEKRLSDAVIQSKADARIAVDKAKSDAERRIAAACASAEKAAEKIQSEAEGLAISEAGILRRAASEKMDDAVRMIVWGIIGKWQ